MLNHLDIIKLLSISPLTAIMNCQTTDLKGEVIELAIITAAGEVLFDRRFKPTTPVALGAARFHGIRTEDLQDCPSIADSFEELMGIIKTHRVVVYNSQFTRTVLENSFDRTCAGWYDEATPYSNPYVETWNRGWYCLQYLYAHYWHNTGPDEPSPAFQSLPGALSQQNVDASDLTYPPTALKQAIRIQRLLQAVAGKWEG